MTSLEGPLAEEHVNQSKEEVLPSLNALNQNKVNGDFGLLEHTSTFIPIDDDGTEFDRPRPQQRHRE